MDLRYGLQRNTGMLRFTQHDGLALLSELLRNFGEQRIV
jgi:hypothetical protein